MEDKETSGLKKHLLAGFRKNDSQEGSYFEMPINREGGQRKRRTNISTNILHISLIFSLSIQLGRVETPSKYPSRLGGYSFFIFKYSVF